MAYVHRRPCVLPRRECDSGLGRSIDRQAELPQHRAGHLDVGLGHERPVDLDRRCRSSAKRGGHAAGR